MNRRNIRLGRIMRIAVCCLLACMMLAPADMDAARRKKRTRATTTQTTTSKKKKKTRTTRRRSTTSGSGNTQSVTQATQEAAINASQGRSSSQGRQQNNNSGLRRITVDKPDLEAIRKATLDPQNKMYFPKLMAKYLQNDTTMTQDEYRYLYLGYMFQEDYDPYRTSPYSEMTDTFRYHEKHTRAEIDTIRKYTELALMDNPFDLRQMSFLVRVLKERRKDMSAKIWEYRLEHLLGAIKSTGTGEDPDNAWYVIYPMHEYDMIQLLGYEAVDVEYVEPGFDHLIVEPDGTVKHRNPAQGFYFNVQVPQQQYELKHPEEGEGAADTVDAQEQVAES